MKSMAQQDVQSLLASIEAQRTKTPLSIISLAEPILHATTTTKVDNETGQHNADTNSCSQPRQSTASSTNSADPDPANLTPASLAADLAHYKDLFSKLRFSYLEQVTKEKYLRGIVGEPVTVYTSDDNAELEQRLGLMKTALQAKKRAVEALVRDMEDTARDLAQRQTRVDEGVRVLRELPAEIEGLEEEVEALRREVEGKEGEDPAEDDSQKDPRMQLSLEETERLLAEQRQRRSEVERQIEELEAQMPDKARECERAEKELEELENRRNESTKLAREMRRMKEMGGRDMLEEQGRWYQSSDIILRELLGVEA